MTTYRNKPPVQWTDMSDATWQAENTAWSPGWLGTVVRNLEYLKLLAYGEGTYTGDVPHTHEGGEDSHAATVNGANIISASCLSGNSMDAEGDYNEWIASGFYDVEGNGYALGGIQGDYIFQTLYFPASNRQYAPRVMGTGADLVLSFFARSRSTSDFGRLEFGIAAGKEGDPSIGSETDTDIVINQPGDLIRGQRGIISGADLTTSWKRFYMRVRDAATDTATGPRFLLRCVETFDHEIAITGVCATQGRRLYPWAPSPSDEPYTSNDGYVGGHAGWQNMSQGVPLLDWSVAMTNAVELEPY